MLLQKQRLVWCCRLCANFVWVNYLSQVTNLRRAESKFTNLTWTINGLFLCVSTVWNCPSSVLYNNTSGLSKQGEKTCYWRKDSYVLSLMVKKNKEGILFNVKGCYSVLHSLYLRFMLPWIEALWLFELLLCKEWHWIASLSWCRSSQKWQLLSAAGGGWEETLCWLWKRGEGNKWHQ